jgi:hypothetical protein
LLLLLLLPQQRQASAYCITFSWKMTSNILAIVHAALTSAGVAVCATH